MTPSLKIFYMAPVYVFGIACVVIGIATIILIGTVLKVVRGET